MLTPLYFRKILYIEIRANSLIYKFLNLFLIYFSTHRDKIFPLHKQSQSESLA